MLGLDSFLWFSAWTWDTKEHGLDLAWKFCLVLGLDTGHKVSLGARLGLGLEVSFGARLGHGT